MVDSGEFELPIFGLRDRRLAAWPKNLIVKVEPKSRDKSARVGKLTIPKNVTYAVRDGLMRWNMNHEPKCAQHHDLKTVNWDEAFEAKSRGASVYNAALGLM